MFIRNQTRLVKHAEAVLVAFYSAVFGGFVAIIQVYRFWDGFSDCFAAINNWLAQTLVGLPGGAGDILSELGSDGLLGAAILGGMMNLVMYFLTRALTDSNSRWGDWLYRNRFYIGIAAVAVCVILNLNNTSLYAWQKFYGGESQAYPVWGMYRPIRSDEWATWSTFAIAQGKTGFRAVNPIMEGGGVDITWVSMGGLPAFNPAMIFKPLYMGFLLFGTERGFSFLWAARCILLMLTSFELAMRMTRGSRQLSLTAMCLVFFAPYVQWWFSQSILELLIFGILMVLAADSYVSAQSIKKKWFMSAVMAYSMGCFVMVGYPGWIVSFLYLITPAIILIFVRGRRDLNRMDAVRLAVPLLAAVAWLLVIVSGSWAALQSVQNSVYPGHRLYTGGRGIPHIFGGLYSTFLQFVAPVGSNECEVSTFVSFAPAGLILAVTGMARRKKFDPLQVMLISIEGLILFFEVFGFPTVIAQMTLLSQCTRNIAVLGVTDILLLIRALSDNQAVKTKYAVLLAIGATAINAAAFGQFYLDSPFVIASVALLYLLAFSVIFTASSDNPRSMRWLCIVLCLTMVCATGLVNPIQRGLDCVEDLELVRALNQVEDESDSLYIVESGWPTTNIPLLAGKRTYNSCCVYANLNKWHVLDPSGSYEDVYNRFAHTGVELIEEDAVSFEVLYGDNIRLYLPYSKLGELGIDYLVTTMDYTNFSSNDLRMIPEGTGNGYTIYRLEYSSGR